MLALGNNYTSGIYNAGLYLRLSREDEDNTSQSQSIINQKDFLTEYAIKNGINIVDYYIANPIENSPQLRLLENHSFSHCIAAKI